MTVAANLLLDAGVPASLVNSEAWTRTEWVRSFGPWPASALETWAPFTDSAFLLIRDFGATGKAALAATLAGEALVAGNSVVWLPPAAFDGPRWLAEALGVHQATEVDLVVIDDLFAGRPTSRNVERALAIIAERYNSGRSTLVTTRRSRRDIAAISPGVSSRVHSGCILTLGGAQERQLVTLDPPLPNLFTSDRWGGRREAGRGHSDRQCSQPSRGSLSSQVVRFRATPMPVLEAAFQVLVESAELAVAMDKQARAIEDAADRACRLIDIDALRSLPSSRVARRTIMDLIARLEAQIERLWLLAQREHSETRGGK